jgi:3D (Asp-Asp-Asp) domain-containing protein
LLSGTGAGSIYRFKIDLPPRADRTLSLREPWVDLEPIRTMHSTRRSTRHRRPLSLGEVGLFAALVALMSGLAMTRHGTGATTAATAKPVGLSLLNVDSPAPPPAAADHQAASNVPTGLPIPQDRADRTARISDPADAPTFDGRPLRRVRQITMLTTAYSPDARSCGKWADGFTASGYSVWTHGMKLVAADTRVLPFGTLVSIPGYNGGRPVPVLDRGGKIKGNRLDLLYPTHEIARQWGAQRLTVDVWEYAD